ncbi:MAG: hypothetical protein HOP12_02340 [Candidatus Eisenbacteria bacterium]|uniref:Uncharacterized protein n=1 Tax=Eiseniibacteriota bacterium TaxID=2212470 RepID=A0A849SUX0_UNCEI|nr:hypothetical protein [Candidatus Eisenbacteria bacterium]
MAEKSFLASVKDEITEVFAAQYDDLVEVTTDEEKLGASLKAVQKRVWEIVEKQLKQSYLNGKKAGNGKVSLEQRKPNPFRRE